jgi:hypothetical protein
LTFQIIFALYSAFSSTGTYYGTGRYDADLTEENIAKAKMVSIIALWEEQSSLMFAPFSAGGSAICGTA